MQFNAKQMREDALIKKGRYKFRVLQGREKTASTGTQMMNLKMVLIINGRDVPFWASLFFLPKMFWQVEHFCLATGMVEKIDEGNLMAQDCDGREGYCDIDHRVNKETGEIEAFVKDWIKPEDTENNESENSNFIDDDVPAFN